MQRKKENENKLRDVYNYINENKVTTQNVHWDAKNLKRDEARNYMQQKKKFEIQQEKFLDLRRKKISELLNGEEAKYHQELIDNQESPEDVRKRMEVELKLLKAQRLNDRDTNVQKLQEKRFYDTTDELRKNDSEAFAVECYLEQENQMLDKLKRREKEKKEEMFYVKLNEFEIEKKKEKEKEEENVKKNKLKNIYDYQQWQREQNEKALKHANEIKDLERQRLKEQWRRDELKEKENLEYIITISSGALSTIDLKRKKYKTRPELPEIFEECKEFLNEKINIDFYGTVVNIVPFEIQKILVSLIATNDNLSIFRFEYFTNYFTRKELLTFNEEQKKFSFEFIKRDPNDESKRNKGLYIDFDYKEFLNNQDISQFLKKIDKILSPDKGLSILNYDIDDSTCRKTIIRYFVLSKKKNNVLKLYYKAFEIPKDVENNFYLPELVFDCVEREKDKNVINIHRIKHNFKFLDNEQLGISLSNINYEKYFNEFLN